jgi:hypothetical protein
MKMKVVVVVLLFVQSIALAQNARPKPVIGLTGTTAMTQISKLAWKTNGNPGLDLCNKQTMIFPCLSGFAIKDMVTNKIFAHPCATATSYSWKNPQRNHPFGIKVSKEIADGQYLYSSYVTVQVP